MATRLDSVMLRGQYCGELASAVFTRSRKHRHWILSISLGDKRARYDLEDVSIKPCWTVAQEYLSGLRDKQPEMFKGYQGRKKMPRLDPCVAPKPLKVIG